LLPNGKVLIKSSQPALTSTEIYDPATGGFSTAGRLTSARDGHTATLLNNGEVLIRGGSATSVNLPAPQFGTITAELYTPDVPVPAPVLFSISDDGKGQGAIWHAQTGQIASADNPGAAIEALSMYTTSLTEGSIIPPQVVVGGRLAQVLYFGAAPGYAGYNQVNSSCQAYPRGLQCPFA
jgi:hypothetical protein